MVNLNSIYSYQANNIYKKSKSNLHDKKELQNIYKTILKINQDSPVYKIDNSNQLHALKLKDAAIDLQNIANVFDKNDDMFEKLKLVSSNDCVKGTILNDENKEQLKELNIKIENLATSQKNQSYKLSAYKNDLFPTSYSFNINYKENIYNFKMDVNQFDNNLSISNRMVEFINQSNIGVKGNIEFVDNDFYITLESNDIGCDSGKFEIYDNNFAGIISKFGLKQTIQKANDANFYINEQKQTIPANIFTVNNSMELELNQPGEVNISFVSDKNFAFSKIKEFTNTYNNIIEITSQNNISSRKLLYSLNEITNKYIDDLNKIGIFEEENYLKVNEDFVFDNIDDENYQQLTNNLSTYQKQLTDLANNININPMDYVDKTIVSYPNYKEIKTNNPYITSIYTGMMFNSYV